MTCKQSWPQCRGVYTGNGQAALPHPSGLKTRSVDAGNFPSLSAGRMGRVTRLPPQLGQRPPSLLSAQSRQKVHSNVQMSASVAAGGRSLSQHSQDGRSASIGSPRTCMSSAIPIGRCSSSHPLGVLKFRPFQATNSSPIRVHLSAGGTGTYRP